MLFVKRTCFLLALWLCSPLLASANEGLWLPLQVPRLMGVDFQKEGLQLTAEEIYSINKASLKDAIISIDDQCSGSIISKNGLILTNYHCIMQRLVDLPQTEKTIKQGYWAYSLKKEQPIPNLRVKKLLYMQQVTADILGGQTFASAQQFNQHINASIKKLEQQYSQKGQTSEVKSFKGGLEYYLFVYKTYEDIRLVGVPGYDLAQFGHDQDNWEWPRYSADFALLRIYADAQGQSIKFNPLHEPLRSSYHLPISTEGYRPGSVTLSMGYPQETLRNHYPWWQSQLKDLQLPHKIRIARIKYNVTVSWLNQNSEALPSYLPLLNDLENNIKYWEGQMDNLTDHGQIIETAANTGSWYQKLESSRKKEYHDLQLSQQDAYLYDLYLYQGLFHLGAFRLSNQFRSLGSLLEKNAPSDLRQSVIDRLSRYVDQHFNRYDSSLDQEMLSALMQTFYENVPLEKHPESLTDNHRKYKGDFRKWAGAVKEQSIFFNEDQVREFLEEPRRKVLADDPLFQLGKAILMHYYGSVYPEINETRAQLKWMKFNDMQAQPNAGQHPQYYDADGTLRVSMGTVRSFSHAQGLAPINTNLEELITKSQSGEDHYQLLAASSELLESASNNKVLSYTPVAFLSDNDLSGGSSGSPVLNGEGQLIGLTFDGNSQWYLGDYIYRDDLQRSINLDIRFFLYILNQTPSKYLFDEISLNKNLADQ